MIGSLRCKDLCSLYGQDGAWGVSYGSARPTGATATGLLVLGEVRIRKLFRWGGDLGDVDRTFIVTAWAGEAVRWMTWGWGSGFAWTVV